METFQFLGLGIDAWITIVTVLGVFAILMATKLRTDLVFLGAIGLLFVTGVLDAKEAFSGFSSTTVVLVGVMSVVVAGLTHTGVLHWIIKHVLGRPKDYKRALLRLMAPVAVLSPFLNTVTVVSVFVGVVKMWAKKLKMMPSRLLIPLHGNNPGNLFDQVQTPEKLASLLTDTDILIISLPGTKETFHLISTPQLSRLPDHAVIINVGRGTVVDQEALEEELQNGRLYAGLDVFEKEPLPAESVLWDSPRAVITPHVAGDTSLPHTVDRIVDLFLEDFENYCTGRPLLRQVDRLIGY